MAEATKTAAPSRTRKPAGTATATKAAAKPAQKAAPATKTASKAATAKEAPQAADTRDDRRKVVQLEFVGETKTFAKFSPPADSGCVGTLYAPLGAEEAKVLIIMAEEDVE